MNDDWRCAKRDYSLLVGRFLLGVIGGGSFRAGCFAVGRQTDRAEDANREFAVAEKLKGRNEPNEK